MLWEKFPGWINLVSCGLLSLGLHSYMHLLGVVGLYPLSQITSHCKRLPRILQSGLLEVQLRTQSGPHLHKFTQEVERTMTYMRSWPIGVKIMGLTIDESFVVKLAVDLVLKWSTLYAMLLTASRVHLKFWAHRSYQMNGFVIRSHFFLILSVHYSFCLGFWPRLGFAATFH